MPLRERADVRDGRRPALASLSDAWLTGRARELRAAVQTSRRRQQLAIIAELDELLDEANARGEPEMVADMLRSAALARLATRGRCQQSEPLLDELLAHTRRAGLPVLRAGAHALRGRRLIIAGKEDAALTEIARALAILDEPPTAVTPSEQRALDRWLVAALTDTWQGLNDLGLYETAEEVAGRVHRVTADSASPHDITMLLLNFIEMLLSWAIRLERVGRLEQAREKYATAASVAEAVEAPFAESLFRSRDAPAIEQVGLVAAAAALPAPAAAHIPRLHRLFTRAGGGQEKTMVGIALARSLEADARLEEGKDVLAAAHEEASAARAPASALLNLVWELARFETDHHDVPEPMAHYTAALEDQLWQMREAHAAALRARREHERLSAAHGVIAKQAEQALQDPLTGLPNRRALDQRLQELSSDAGFQPVAVGLVDLDGFKGVNDTQSHAEGDDVLRVIASTLRDALRGDDFVARYGGDEFVLLLPGAPAGPAEMAMNRVVAAVDDLPAHLARDVTLSVGLVSMAPAEHPESVLARADAAMYEAKRNGGNRVATATQPDPDAG